jgi:hypothetical protein
MRGIVRRTGRVEVPNLDDTKAFLDALDLLTAHETDLVLEVLVLASFPDGHISRAEIALLEGLLARDGRALDKRALKAICKHFVRGDALTRDELRSVLGLGTVRASDT